MKMLNKQGKIYTRNSNIELYRIIVMILIVAHHSVWHSGVMEELENNPFSAKSMFYYILGMWGRTGIDCFVLITGYFMCKSQITLQKYLKLLLEIEFYNIIIYGIFVILGKQPFSIVQLFFAVFPFAEIGGLFVPCFMLFYLFIPFLNILVSHMDKKMHKRLIALCLLIYTVMMMLPYFHVTMNHITWYSILFVIASYIRYYGLFPQFNTTEWGLVTLACIILSISSVICVIYFNQLLGKETSPYKYVSPSGICAVLTSISSFMLFKKLNIPKSNLINTIAGSTFGVLLIHDNCYLMRQWLWNSIMNVKYIYSLEGYAPYSYIIIGILCIFFICFGIDLLRKYTIEKYTLKKIKKYTNTHEN